MTKIDFNNRKVDFFSIISFVKKNNLNHSNVLEQAFQQEVLIDDNKLKICCTLCCTCFTKMP